MSTGGIWFLKKNISLTVCTCVCLCVCLGVCVCPLVHVSCDGLVTYPGRIPTSQPVTAWIDSSTSHHPDWEYVDGRTKVTHIYREDSFTFIQTLHLMSSKTKHFLPEPKSKRGQNESEN